MASVLPGYVPLVLDPAILADGFGVQILELVQLTLAEVPLFAPLPQLFAPKRKGKNQIVFTLQNALDDDPEDPSPIETAAICIRLRSPFVYDDGNPKYAPSVKMLASPSNLVDGPTFQMKLDTSLTPGTGGLLVPTTLADQNQNPSFGYSPTFMGKKIPNWSFFLPMTGMSDTNLPPTYVFDWHASVRS